MAHSAVNGVYEVPLPPPQPSLVPPPPASSHSSAPVGCVHHGYAPNGAAMQLAPGESVGHIGPPSGISHEVWSWFQAVDSDHNGCITSEELQRALINSNWSYFNAETCRMMVGLFDLDNNGTIDIYEFGSLWRFVQEWKACFESFDQDRSGNIDANELMNAFQTFGYQLSVNFANLCIQLFDRKCCKSINLDDFIQCCVMVKTLTDRFRERDTTMGGVLKIEYEEFLRMVLDNKVI